MGDIRWAEEYAGLLAMAVIPMFVALTALSGDAPVELNGIFVLEFAEVAQVKSLREWWHAR